MIDTKIFSSFSRLTFWARMGLLRSNPQSGLDVPSIKLDVCVHSHRCIYPAVFSGYCVDMVTLAVLNLLVPLSESEVAQSCLTLCSPMDCSPPGSSVHGIFQARILEWVAISLSGGSSWPRDRTQVSHIAGRCFSLWATREACSSRHILMLLSSSDTHV